MSSSSVFAMTTTSETSLRITSDPRLMAEWELVLVAEGLSPSVVRSSHGMIIAVPDEEADRAIAALTAYDKENLAEPKQAYEPITRAGLTPGIAVASGLLLFFFVTTEWKSTVPWFERGSADAGRILHGEVWRAVTALTLHTDIVHALGNAVGVVVFFGAVFSLLGLGLGSALVTLAGAGGNLANAFLHGSPHLSVGASTSVFAAVGALGAIGMLRRRRTSPHRQSWIPIAAALALLAMLGSSGERVDIWAHLFGLLLGGAAGIAIGFRNPNPPKLWIQWVCGGATLGLLIYSWVLALG